MDSEIADRLVSGQLARLIPVVADSKKEERATSCLLAAFMVVPTYARDVLADAGAPVGKRIKIDAYTEITFKSANNEKNPRPDGLIVIHNGSKKWTALVESKIGAAELNKDQIEEYLDLAKKHNIDALITISNQFATTPTHHPIKTNKAKLKSTELYHFSWLSLVSKAILLSDNKKIEDQEQAYILNELVRYLDHDSSGVTSLTKMHSAWKETCNSVQQGTVLQKNSIDVENTVASWHQLLRHLALNLGIAIGEAVHISLTKSRAQDSELNLQEDCVALCKDNCLSVNLDIPNAASKLTFSADFLRRTLNISMKLDAPKDKSRATASINWFTRQLKNSITNNITIRAYWPKRIPMTTAPLAELLENPALIIPPNTNELPTYIEAIRIIDLATRFKGPKTVVEDATRELPLFYKDVCQDLSKWIPKPPKVKGVETDSKQPSTTPADSEEILIPLQKNDDEVISKEAATDT